MSMAKIRPDEGIIGLQGPTYEVDIERGRVRQFAKSVYAFDSAYHEDPRAVVPPTFLIMSGYHYGYILARAPANSAFGRIDEDFRTCADGGQEFVFHGPLPRAGDRLIASTSMHDFKEREGRRGGRLRIYVTRTRFHTPQGLHVADWFEWNVKTAQSPVQSLDEARVRDRPYFMKGDRRDQFNAIRRQGWADLRLGEGSGSVTMPALTVTDIVAYQYASGEDGPTHHDDGSARACGYPGIYSMGMLHGGAMATYAVNWLGPQNIRRFKCRFDEMQFPGDVISYTGWVVRLFEEAGERKVDVKLDFRRGDRVLGRAWATFVAP
jgi:acyl dehydratase